MHKYIANFVIESYTLADAFRPNPLWGQLEISANVDELPPHDDDDILNAAMEQIPFGYRLAHIREQAPGNDARFLFQEPALRMMPPANRLS